MSRHSHPHHRSADRSSRGRDVAPPNITLYDIPGNDRGHTPQPWNPEVWCIRLVLNYKQLPYKTVWVDNDNVQTTLKPIIEPTVTPDGRREYKVPVIVDSSRYPMKPKAVSNSYAIVEYLESAYPARPVIPEGSGAMQAMFVHSLHYLLTKQLEALILPTIWAGAGPVLQGPQKEQAWVAVKDKFGFLEMIMDKNTCDGVFVMGNEVSYADFALCSILIFIKKTVEKDGWFRVRSWNKERWSKLYERCKRYMDEF